MAIKDYINVSYLFKGNQGLKTNNTNVLDIHINPQLDMGFTLVTCSLHYQILGKAISNKSKISTILIDQNSFWKKKENYKYQEQFVLGNLPTSYNGKNLQIIWWLYLEVSLDQESKSRIQNSLLKDIFVVSLIQSFDGKHQNKNVVTVTNQAYQYEIIDFDLVYKVDPYLYFIIGIFILIITTILYIGDILEKYIWIPTVVGIGSTSYGLYKINSIGRLKEVRFKGTPIDNKSFNLEINILKNEKKISSAIVRYTIIEEVIDDRGTGSTTYREKIYKSESKTINTPGKILHAPLSYPSKDIPIDFSRENVRFYTQIEVLFEFKNNTSSTIKQDFPLIKLS